MTEPASSDVLNKVIVIGAGPAGLTAGYELLNKSDFRVTIIDKNDKPGGIARTVEIGNNLSDIGPHRFFSRSRQIIRWWSNMLPLQGPSDRTSHCPELNPLADINGPDPETNNKVLLIKKRITRILYRGKLFRYPVKIGIRSLLDLGLFTSFKAVINYLFAMIFKRKEKNLEDFFVNRFGRTFYRIFFENYTEKVWGIHPSNLSADWGSQRIKNISFIGLFKDYLASVSLSGNNHTKESLNKNLVEDFFYFPKYGSGQMWETAAEKFMETGGEIQTNTTVTGINVIDNRIVSVVTGESSVPANCDWLFSSMPIDELIMSLNGIDIPDEIMSIALSLPFRDYIMAGIILKNPENSRKAYTKHSAYSIQDNWIYIQEKNVKAGRVFFINNFSKYMVSDNDAILLCAEYFCNEGDDIWTMDEASFLDMAVAELEKTGFLRKEDVIEAYRVMEKKAYPAYYGSYPELSKVISFLDGIKNLYCIGRNGQHRYNNMDHSMLTAIEAVHHLINNPAGDRSKIWNINTESEYHENNTGS